MYSSILFLCLTSCAISYSMDLQPGQKVTWHERIFRVTERYVNDNQITIVMTRPSHHLLCVPVTHEEITRIYDIRECQDDYKHPSDTQSKTCLTHAGALLIPTSLICATLLALHS